MNIAGQSGTGGRLRRGAGLGAAALCCLAVALAGSAEGAERRLPNIVLVVADDLGYGDLGCYGQQIIETPRLDRMAAEGMRFTQFYAGSTVCAPSRCVLLTGLHTGHVSVRGNGPPRIQSLRRDDTTIAELLREAGYTTALFGKWGLGSDTPDNEGRPNDQGFDYFYGYLNQTHAHNYYPEFLWCNTDRVPLRNVVQRLTPDAPSGVATTRIDYSHDLITDEALKFIEQHRDLPFFLYWAPTIPHANNEAKRATGDGQEVPDYGLYADRPWPNPDKGQAAMISRLDADVGRLLDLLVRLEIDDRTLVLFTSDNGPHQEGGQDVARFRPAGPLRGMKRDLYEGGIRVPLVARWPGTIAPAAVSDHVSYVGDFFSTLAELIGAAVPPELDSISFLPTLTGCGRQRQHEYLYWEFYEQGGKQAVRWKNWKLVRQPMPAGRTELYDLDSDLGETTDVASQYPDVVSRIEALMDEAHVPHPDWRPTGKAGD